MCSTQWPQELHFEILPNFLVELVQIIFGTGWWWWGEKWSRFVKIQE
jgi:hypothetical protein